MFNAWFTVYNIILQLALHITGVIDNVVTVLSPRQYLGDLAANLSDQPNLSHYSIARIRSCY